MPGEVGRGRSGRCPRRRALILSGRFGKGHDTVAEASAAALAPLGVESRTLDAIALLPGPGSGLGDRIFRSLLKRPAVYDGFHFSQLRTGGRLAAALDRTAVTAMYPQFLREVRAGGAPPDLVLSVFATGAGAGARYKAHHPEVVTAVFVTDSYAHRLWVHEGTDLVLVTSALSAHAVRSFRPDARVAVVTHPTRPAFYSPPPRSDARDRLGVPPDACCVLLMSGAWGIGPVADCAAALARAGVWVLAVAGSNRELAARLDAVAAGDRRVLPFGYTDRVPELMAASDLVISSSGDTCREARVVGRALVLLDVVPGHGRENLMHELELGGAVVSATEPDVLTRTVMRLFDHPDRLDVVRVACPERWERELREALAEVGFR
jgi:UDP-N-acetylglucosamine:LPS N-acetylglucosamine transferase